ncbi:MAG: HNH endonuclease [Candidatus Roizmanbacteria bacterium]|nr:HNH endonuclease [Candidatus Roizmanbacteria bacterium]
MKIAHIKNPTRYWLGKKRPDLKATGASKTMFKKGHIPWSKSQKGVCLNSGKTHFSTGHTSWLKGKAGVYRGARHWNWKGGIFDHERKIFLNGRRRATKIGAIGSHSQEDWESLKKGYNHTCLCCNKREPDICLTEDHIISLYDGGSDYIENIQPLCKSCNSKKNIKSINFKEEYEYANLQRLGL